MMKRIATITAVIIVIAVPFVLFYLESGEDGTAQMTVVKDDVVASPMESVPRSELDDQPGTYTEFTPASLASTSEGDKKVLFFHAAWCPTCHLLDEDINQNIGSIPSGTHIYKVNYDTETGLKQKYDVRYQHTLVQVDSDGNQIAKWSQSPALDHILGMIQ